MVDLSSSLDLETFLEQKGRSELDIFLRELLTGTRDVVLGVIRRLSDERFAMILDKSQKVACHTYTYPSAKPLAIRTAEEWFGDHFKRTEKQKDPTLTIRTEMIQKKWKETSEEDKKAFVEKATEDQVRFDREQKEYLDQKKLMILSSNETFSFMQSWHERNNAFLAKVDNEMTKKVIDLGKQFEDVIVKNKGQITQSKTAPKRKRDTGGSHAGGGSNGQGASKQGGNGRSKRNRRDVDNDSVPAPNRKTKKEAKTSRKGKTPRATEEEKKTRKDGKGKSNKPSHGTGDGRNRGYNSFRAHFKEENPQLVKTLAHDELTKKISGLWKAMTPEQKQPFKQRPPTDSNATESVSEDDATDTSEDVKTKNKQPAATAKIPKVTVPATPIVASVPAVTALPSVQNPVKKVGKPPAIPVPGPPVLTMQQGHALPTAAQNHSKSFYTTDDQDDDDAGDSFTQFPLPSEEE